jgi:hypothetical protein
MRLFVEDFYYYSVFRSHSLFKLEARDKFGRSPYLTACLYGSTDAISSLSEEGADTSAVDKQGRNGLMLFLFSLSKSRFNSNRDVRKIIYEIFESVRRKQEDILPILSVLDKRNLSIVHYLSKVRPPYRPSLVKDLIEELSGISLDSPFFFSVDSYHRHPFLLAIQAGDLSFIEWVYSLRGEKECLAAKDVNGHTLVHYAAHGDWFGEGLAWVQKMRYSSPSPLSLLVFQ